MRHFVFSNRPRTKLRGILVTLTVCAACTRSASDGPPQRQPLVTASGTITGAADETRTGWYPDQAALDPGIVGGSTFGRIFTTTLTLRPQEQVYAQPLFTGTSVFVATESNNIYALDSETGVIKAARSIGTPWAASDIGCGDLQPDIGVTGAPVIDTTTNTAFFLSKTYRPGTTGPARANAQWLAHGVDMNTLDERPGFPLEIQGNAANDSTVTFDPFAQMQRPGLLLLGGVVYAGFGGHCDFDDYHGWVVGFSTTGQLKTLFATEAGPQKARGAGIWQSGGGLVSDGPGRIFFVTGNGYSNAITSPIPGNTPPAVLDESVVRLQVQADGSLQAVDFFANYDLRFLDDADLDFGSGAPVALPPSFGTPAIPNLLVVGGKEGIVYLLNRDNLGGFEQGPNAGDAVVSQVNVDGGLWSRPAVWPGDGGWVYVTSNSAQFQALKYGIRGDGVPTLAIAGRSADNFGYTSGSPIVTSDGTRSGSALVWVTQTDGPSGQGQLRAYDAIPTVAGALTLRYEDAYGSHAKFTTPGVGAGRIYVGTRDGRVIGYGAPKLTAVSGDPVAFGTVSVGTTAGLVATLTASRDVTITAVAITSAAFATGTPGVAWPVSLTAGQSISVPVSFTPPAALTYTAALDITTDQGPSSVSLRGTGQTAGPQLAASPAAISFGGLALNASKTVNVVLSNSGSTPLTFAAPTVPVAPFAVVGAPTAGQVLEPGAQTTVAVTFSPTANGSYSDDLALASDGGTVTIFLSGNAAGAGKLVITPLALDFGTVASGNTKALTFTVANQGDSDLTITKSKPPSLGMFVAATPIAEGTVIPAGTTLTETITFQPSNDGSFSDSWILTGSEGGGAQTVAFSGATSSGGNGLSATYYDNIDFTGPTITRVDPVVDFNWGNGSPDPAIGPDTFSARWTGQVLTPVTGTYTFYTLSDDGIRLTVNGQPVINNFTDHPPTENTGTLDLVANQKYDVLLEFYENGGGAAASLSWSAPGVAKQVIPQTALFSVASPPPPSASGLSATYYDNIDFTGATVTRIDSTVDFDWGVGSPDPSLGVDTFSARWTGTLKAPTSETYTFYTLSDDGVRLFIDGAPIINDWTDHTYTQDQGTIALVAGQSYAIKLEYYENTGGALVQLAWSSPSTVKTVVPASALSPP